MVAVVEHDIHTGRDVLTSLSGCDVATLHEAAGRVGNLSPAIRPIQDGAHIAGRAVTAAVQPGDNLAIHRAVLECRPGDVLVVAANGHLAGYWGEILAVAAQSRGVLGLVIDGGCRDVAALRKRDFPVWSAGISVHGTTKRAPGTVNSPVAVGNVLVTPGDYVVADDDGVVCIAAARIHDVLAAASARAEREEHIMAGLVAGGTTFELMGIERVDPS
jgi:4-hydroxy-4-methyl-2-oxoglutarate aldolase